MNIIFTKISNNTSRRLIYLFKYTSNIRDEIIIRVRERERERNENKKQLL